MSGLITNRISNISKKLTRSQNTLVDYFKSANVNSLIYLSITEVADVTGVGEATILRFCRLLGFTGYQDFKLSLAQELTGNSASIDESFHSLICNNFISTLTLARQSVDVDAIMKAAKVIRASKNVSVFGVGNSYVPALELHNRLLKMGIYSLCETSAHMENMIVTNFSESDCLILFSVSGGSKDIIEVAEIAHRNGVNIIAITSYDKSPLTKYSDNTILSIRKESPIDAGSMLTKVVQLYIVDVLSTGILLEEKEKFHKNIEKSHLSVVNKLL